MNKELKVGDLCRVTHSTYCYSNSPIIDDSYLELSCDDIFLLIFRREDSHNDYNTILFNGKLRRVYINTIVKF